MATSRQVPLVSLPLTIEILQTGTPFFRFLQHWYFDNFAFGLTLPFLYPVEQKAPEVVATSLISAFPGESLAAKSGNVVLTASIAAFLISKEIYLIDGEFFEMLCIFGAYYVWFSGGKEAAAKYFADKQSVRLEIYRIDSSRRVP